MKKCVNYDKGLADNIQDLLNAVVIQAAEDFRDCSVNLMLNPKSKEWKKRKDNVIRFFLSSEFKAFTRVQGKYILTRLQEEIADLEETCVYVKTARAVLLLEAERAAESFLQRGEVPPEAEERIRLILSQLQDMQDDLPVYAKRLVTVPRYEDLMADVINAKGGNRIEQQKRD